MPRKVVGQNPQPTESAGIRRSASIKDQGDKAALQKTNTMVQPKDVYKDMGKKDTAEKLNETKETLKEEGKIRNGPHPTDGIQFENKSQLIYYKRTEMCRSTCGLPLWYITISRDKKSIQRKPTIIVSSRVHSGETPASTVFKGIFDFLCSDRKEAKFLRKFYTFILIPVLNPDGVVCGNYRNSIAGVDLNRQWINPDMEFHPEVYYIK